MRPPAAESVSLANAGLRLRCLRWGRPDDPTVLLLHGNGAHAHWWVPIVPALVPGWRVVAPDLRGHGESRWAEPPAYTLRDYAGDLDAIVADLAPGDAPLAVVGHSMGGRIALWFSAQHPERMRALAVLDTRFDPVLPEEAARYRPGPGGTRGGRRYPSHDAAMAAFRFVPDEPDVPADIVALLAEHALVEREPGVWAYRFDRAALRMDGDAAGDLRRCFSSIRCPVLVGRGAASWVLDREEHARLVQAFADAEGHEFRGGHHFPLTDAETLGATLRRFLDRHR